MAGGGDQSAQAVGMGAVEPGTVAVTLGTSGVVFAATESPLIEPEGRLHAFCHALPNRWHLMGVMLSAAGSLQWYRDTLAPDMSFDALVEEAEEAPAGSEGLLFLPYLSGERTPYPDPLARGSWIGLTVRHKRAHLTRAVLEGVSFGLRDGFDLLNQAGLKDVQRALVSGGGARSELWLQILATCSASISSATRRRRAPPTGPRCSPEWVWAPGRRCPRSMPWERTPKGLARPGACSDLRADVRAVSRRLPSPARVFRRAEHDR